MFLSLERRKAAVAAFRTKDYRRLPTLPGGCPPSTIGASRLNFSVRNGKRCFPAAMTAELSISPVPNFSLAWAYSFERYAMCAPSKLHTSTLVVQNQALEQLLRVR